MSSKLGDLSYEKRSLLLQRLLKKESNKEHIHNEQKSSLIKNMNDDSQQLPLSFAQKRLWFVNQLNPDHSFYNIPFVLRLIGSFHYPCFVMALNEIVKRHDSLRTRIVAKDGIPMQVRDRYCPFEVELIDLSASESETILQQADSILEQKARTPFDLSEDVPVRFCILKLKEQEHIFLASFHHIAVDGWSIGVFMKELTDFYNSSVSGSSLERELPFQYADFSTWQTEWLTGEQITSGLNYWKQQLLGVESLSLPTDYTRPVVPSYRGDTVRYTLPNAISKMVNLYAEEHNYTLFMSYLSVLKVLLSRYSGQDDITIGTPIANRNKTETKGIIGFFANTIVIRSHLAGELSFRSLLDQIRETSLKAYENQDVPFEKIVEEIHPDRNSNLNPLFQVMFIFQSSDNEHIHMQDLQIAPMQLDTQTSKFDITFTVQKAMDEHQIHIQYNTDIFKASTIERMIQHYELLLTQLFQAPEAPMAQFSMLTEAELLQLKQWGMNQPVVAMTKCVHDLISCIHYSESIAIVHGEVALTYKEIYNYSNQFAHYISSFICERNQLIGILMDRSVEMIVALLGILKAGCAYVPIDPGYPTERLEYMISESNIQLIVTNLDVPNIIPSYKNQVVPFNHLDVLQHLRVDKYETDVLPEDLAYVIYTSGSTGKPKGIAMPHQVLVNLLEWHKEHPTLGEPCRTLQFTTISFDVAFQEIFSTLYLGGTLILIRNEDRDDFSVLADIIISKRVERIFMPFVALNQLAETCVLERKERFSLKNVVTAGEQLLINQKIRQFFHNIPNCTLHNHYGPSETHVVTEYMMPQLTQEWEDIPPIGASINNVGLYVLDKYQHMVPIGVKGELYVAGQAVSNGYMNREDLTRDSFVQLPIAPEQSILYKTGDMVSFREDGNLNYYGRLDKQVKIRGYRIELSEIESVIMSHRAIQDVFVLVQERKYIKFFVAYYTIRPANSLTIEELKGYVATLLPRYMIPSFWSELQEIPLLPNGKVNRAALPDPERSFECVEADDEPQTELEKTMAQIWCEVLGLVRLGVNQSFFDVGGHSLLATQVISRIRSQLNMELPLRILFEHHTIKELSHYISNHVNDFSHRPIVQIGMGDERVVTGPLSFSQKRLWYIEHMELTASPNNIPLVLHMKGTLLTNELEKSIQCLVKRHDLLRTTFHIQGDGQPEQVIHPVMNDKLKLILINGEGKRNIKNIIQELLQHKFDLSIGPLIRFHLIYLGLEEWIFLINMHHIISDGWSISILLKELTELYNAYVHSREAQLEQLPFRYLDYCYWQNEHLIKEQKYEQQLNYWTNKLSGELHVLNLETDKQRPTTLTSRGKVQQFSVDPKVYDLIQTTVKQTGLTPFMIVLSSFKVLLHRYTGQSDIIVGTPIAGRSTEDLEKVLGFFVNTLVLRTTITHDMTFLDVLEQVKQTSLEAYSNQDVPFDKIVEKVRPIHDVSRFPLFQVMFSFNNTPAADIKLENVQVEPYEFDVLGSKFDLTVTIQLDKDGLIGVMRYNSDIFDDHYIEQFIAHFQHLLSSSLQHNTSRISELSLMSREEENCLIELSRNEATTEICTFIKSFEERVKVSPKSIAVIYGDNCITYDELNKSANQIANCLIMKGVKAEGIIGVHLDLSIELVSTLIGIIKAGAAYVVVNPSWPAGRIMEIAHDTGMKLIITCSNLHAIFNETIEHILLDSYKTMITLYSDANPKLHIDSKSLACVAYSFHSLDQTKAIQVDHGQLMNYCTSTITGVGLSPEEHYVVKHPGAESIIQSLLFPALMSGGQIHLSNTYSFRTADIDWLKMSPSLLAEEVNRGGFIMPRQGFILSGELVHTELILKIKNMISGLKLVVEYRKTEVPTALFHHVSVSEEAYSALLPLGKPPLNVEIYVLGTNMEPVPRGVIGEMYIGGSGVGRGYLNQPRLTAECFVPNPYALENGSKLYKTGDLVRLSSDGLLQYKGRKNEIYSLYGYQLDIYAIENVLISHPHIINAKIIVSNEDQLNEVCAYILPMNIYPLSIADLFSWLKGRLPIYMIPHSISIVPSFPYTEDGIVDTSLLDTLYGSYYDETLLPQVARDNIELRLSMIWEKLIQVDHVSVNSNFFSIGGHSLLLIQLISEIRNEFNVEIPPASLLQECTISHLADVIRSKGTVKHSFLVPLNQQVNSPKLFVIHPVSGMVYTYQHLAKCLDGISVIGIQAQGVMDALNPIDNIKEMARKYVIAIRDSQAKGPYYLAGWSIGGMIAFEVAQQMKAIGEDIQLLALFDTYYFKNVCHKAFSESQLIHKFIMETISNFGQENNLEWIDSVNDSNYTLSTLLELAKSKGIIPYSFSYSGMESLFHVYKSNVLANQNYEPEYLEQELMMFKAVPKHVGDQRISLYNWNSIVSKLEVISVAGDHYSMFNEENSRIIAQHILKRLNILHSYTL
ncbi:amino acid adenylation domain-containing protein [Paenibacillus sp. MER 180]|uniref:amino acid adenylation domain-containing protein n=1 Tax=Paenibacillus sp. MER 180 TaxID=2939570 RepID=UPI00203CF14C|nr:non-ribosomal peptide synthetase [Paenibacillus sp. MER 180]MCM3291594.1 amino acid adenylation domain-containing protein [Paenibacillus sp. MER 180]